MGLINIDVKTAVDEAAQVIVPPLQKSVADLAEQLPKALIDALDGIEVTITLKRKTPQQ